MKVEALKPQIVAFRIEATNEEATLILDVLGQVGGSPVKSRRGLADRIKQALREAGVEETSRPSENGYRPKDMNDGAGVYFRDACEC